MVGIFLQNIWSVGIFVLCHVTLIFRVPDRPFFDSSFHKTPTQPELTKYFGVLLPLTPISLCGVPLTAYVSGFPLFLPRYSGGTSRARHQRFDGLLTCCSGQGQRREDLGNVNCRRHSLWAFLRNLSLLVLLFAEFPSKDNIAGLPANILAKMSGYVLIPGLTGVTDWSISTIRILRRLGQVYGA